jgi:DNA repair exonuclease SbcCD ATPase subunit
MLQVSNLPKCDILFFDEPATALDSEHLDSFTKILDIAKSYYNKVFIITHIDALKDYCDQIIEIQKENNFAKIII